MGKGLPTLSKLTWLSFTFNWDPRYKRVLGSFVFLLWTLISFHSIGVPKEMHLFFPQTGNPLLLNLLDLSELPNIILCT